MQKRIVIPVVSAAFAAFLISSLTYAQDAWVGKAGNLKDAQSRSFLADNGEYFVATRNGIYRTSDVNGNWSAVFALPSGSNEVKCMAGSSGSLLVGTRKGLFKSSDSGQSWKKVFRAIIPEKNDICCVVISRDQPGKIAIGTARGVFLSSDGGGRWQDISDNIRNTDVRCLAINGGRLFAGGEGGLYIRQNVSSGWERILVKGVPEKSSEEDGSDTPYGDEEEYPAINCIAACRNRLYISMYKEILYSNDDGSSWRNFSCEGLGGQVNHILISAKSGKLYCGTTKGAFEFDPEKSRWQELYKGMDKTLSVTRLAFESDDEKTLWAVTDSGLYRLESGRFVSDQYIDVERNLKSLQAIFANEPAFQELQNKAIEYAEVSPDKIKRWRKEARLRALMPKVSVGLDNKRSSNYEIYTSATKDYVTSGPDDISDGWDVSVSWELGDLIWSDDQTNIDVRSRLMVQLRNDILDDLRRAYYERKRLQFELITDPPKDLKVKFEKELRLKELTSAIDDLTGNYLSENIKSREGSF